ncbi:MAG: hypothetical protein IKO06_04865 [Alphaproteobacteria bacterium]|nr:hypothetical protein [Alphaproteobacteria bacterium]
MRNLEIKNNDCHAALAMTKSVQSGRSMIEMLGVLAIIGVLSVGGIAGYSKAMMKYRTNKFIEQITLIAGNVHTFFARQSNYEGAHCECVSGQACTGQTSKDGCPVIKKAKIFPDEMVTVDADGKITAITDSFGNLIGGINAIGKGDNDTDMAFRLDFGNTPEEACIDIITHDWSAVELNVIEVGPSGGRYYIKTPITVDQAIIACNKGDSNLRMLLYFDVDVNSSIWKKPLEREGLPQS